MVIRTATVDELNKLWGANNSPTKAYFIKGMKEGNVEFWTIENKKDASLIGELYIFWNSKDHEEANGKDRAYLCAFRINSEFRGQGLGKDLMMRVLERVKEKGFKEVTIGADNDNAERLIAMYRSWGFSELVKLQNTDYHYLDENNQPTYYEEPWALLLNRL